MRDLGYFVGYAITKKYYDKTENKRQAIKELIELDYNNESDLIEFVDKTNYFEKPVNDYKIDFENNRPFITGIEQFENNSQSVNPNIKLITLYFSKPMNTNLRSFDYGPLGKDNLIKIEKVIGFNKDSKSFSFETILEPNKILQLLINYGFRSSDNVYPLKPYLIDIKTSK